MADLELTKGSDEEITFIFTEEDKSPTDLTDAIVFFTVKKGSEIGLVDPTDANAVIKATKSAISDPLLGIVPVKIPRAEMDVEVSDKYIFDVQLRNSSDEVCASKRGTLSVSQRVTQRTS